MAKRQQGEKYVLVLSGPKQARCLLPESLSHPRKRKVTSHSGKTTTKWYAALQHKGIQRQRYRHQSGCKGTQHTRGRQNNRESHRVPSGASCVCVLIFFLLLGHMLLTRFSAQRKKRVLGNGDGDRRARASADEEGSSEATDHTQENHQESQTEWEVTLSLSPEVREGSQQSLSISAGSGICGTAWTLLCQQEVG